MPSVIFNKDVVFNKNVYEYDEGNIEYINVNNGNVEGNISPAVVFNSDVVFNGNVEFDSYNSSSSFIFNQNVVFKKDYTLN